jgi:hypothetical protein
MKLKTDLTVLSFSRPLTLVCCPLKLGFQFSIVEMCSVRGIYARLNILRLGARDLFYFTCSYLLLQDLLVLSSK